VKKLALLSATALSLASMVFAPVAIAREDPGTLDFQSARLGDEGSIILSGTIECTEGAAYSHSLSARQAHGNKPIVNGRGAVYGTCTTTGAEPFTAVEVFSDLGQRPFKKGNVRLTWGGFFCDDTGPCDLLSSAETIRVR
jgi:hypothetical protein